MAVEHPFEEEDAASSSNGHASVMNDNPDTAAATESGTRTLEKADADTPELGPAEARNVHGIAVSLSQALSRWVGVRSC